MKAGAFDLRVQWDVSHVAGAQTVIVPGLANPAMPISDDVLTVIRAAAASGARVASICTGAFVLAAAGLLDGLRATMHWLAAPELAARYPRIAVDADVLFVDNDRVLTSAGAAAGFDMCLHMIRRDDGSALAAHAARLAVMPLEREGGQVQYIRYAPPASTLASAGRRSCSRRRVSRSRRSQPRRASTPSPRCANASAASSERVRRTIAAPSAASRARRTADSAAAIALRGR